MRGNLEELTFSLEKQKGKSAGGGFFRISYFT